MSLSQCEARREKMSFIAVDGDRSCLFELLEDRRLHSLFNHYQQFTLASKVSGNGYECRL